MNKQQTAVEWLEIELEKLWVEKYLSPITIKPLLDKAKEMEKEQSHLYSAFCFKCINEKIPVIKFEDWINL
jgi:hypothetical protein